jgi:hypothetical protein
MISTLVLLSVSCAAALDTSPFGEPYEMLGTRLVFTNWHFIRAGSFAWLDREGKPAYATRDFKFEPDECQWKAGPNNAWGVRIRACKPGEIRQPDIPLEKPWESQPISFDSIVEDNGVYKAWGSCGAPCYFESKDGVHWTRPNVGLVEFQGSRENNMVPKPPIRHVFVDPSSETERYKCVYEAMITAEEFEKYRQRRPDGWRSIAQREIGDKTMYCCLKGMVSKDGFTWEDLPDPLVVDHTDTLDVGWYDARRKKYVIFVRTWNTFPRAESDTAPRWDSWLNHARRCIGRIEGDDFRNLPLPETVLEAGPDLSPNAGLYTNCFTWVPKAPDCLLMFPAVYDVSNDTTEIRLASSLDGKVWNWVPGGALKDTAAFGQWDGGCIFTNPPLLEQDDGSFALMYHGSNVPHKYPRGLMKSGWAWAIWPHGRLAAVEAEEKGEFSTVALIPKGIRLYVNARTKRAGSVRVAVQSAPGAEALPGHGADECIAIVGDQPRALVRWNDSENLGVEAGKPVVLRFKMEQAELFSIEFGG